MQLSYGGTIAGSYGYFPDGRLATSTLGGTSASYLFDVAGNLISDTEGSSTTTFDYNQDTNELSTSETGSNTNYYSYDANNGWRTSQGPSANPTQVQYSYTGTGRLATYADSGAGVSASYVYDAAGQRTYAGASTAFGDSSFGITYRYDGTTLLSLSGADSDGNSWRIDYLYDEEGNPYGGVYRDPSTSTSPVFFSMVTTDRGDVVELLDANGVPFASYRYDAWGKPTASSYTPTSLIGSTTASNIEFRQVLRYGGYAYDWWSGLYYCSARYYDPVTRQWISKDPANADGEASEYQYCDGDPTGETDPAGCTKIESANWCGYRQDASSVQGIRGAFTFKQCKGSDAYDVAWLGIGSSDDSSLVQAGANMSNKKAFWETLPMDETYLGSIKQNHRIWVKITAVLGVPDMWNLVMKDKTKGKVLLQTTLPYDVFQPEACWIFENIYPYHIGTFGTVHFTQCEWKGKGGTWSGVTSNPKKLKRIWLKNYYGQQLWPSVISGGTSFTVHH